MNENESPSANGLAVPDRIDGDNLDLDAMRDLSVHDYEQQYGETKITGKNRGPQEEVLSLDEAIKSEEGSAEDDSDEDPEESDDDVSEEEEEQSEEDEEGESEEDDEDDEEEDSEPEEEQEEGKKGKKSKYLEAKTSDGKTYKVAKDAEVQISVNGKPETLTMQELVNRASGAINIERGNSELGRKRAKFEQEKREFDGEITKITDNLAMINNIAQNGTPEEFVQYYALLTGEDPAAVMSNMVNRMAEYAESFENMTERERKLYSENQKYRLQKGLEEIQTKRAQRDTASQQEKAQVAEILKNNGLSWDDFFTSAGRLRDMVESGQINGTVTAIDIAKYASSIKHENDVKSAIKAVDKSLVFDNDFVSRAIKAVASAEAFSGEKFSPKEIQDFIRGALNERRKGISESLKRKADRQIKSGKTNSKIASSRTQAKRSDEALTLEAHRERLWGGE